MVDPTRPPRRVAAPPPPPQQQQRTRLVVRAIPPSLTEGELRASLEAWPVAHLTYTPGETHHAEATTVTHAVAHLQMPTHADALALSAALDGAPYCDSDNNRSRLTVEWALCQLDTTSSRGQPKSKLPKGSIYSDRHYLDFVEQLDKAQAEARGSKAPHLSADELARAHEKKKKAASEVVITPLMQRVLDRERRKDMIKTARKEKEARRERLMKLKREAEERLRARQEQLRARQEQNKRKKSMCKGQGSRADASKSRAEASKSRADTSKGKATAAEARPPRGVPLGAAGPKTRVLQRDTTLAAAHSGKPRRGGRADDAPAPQPTAGGNGEAHSGAAAQKSRGGRSEQPVNNPMDASSRPSTAAAKGGRSQQSSEPLRDRPQGHKEGSREGGRTGGKNDGGGSNGSREPKGEGGKGKGKRSGGRGKGRGGGGAGGRGRTATEGA